MDYSKLTQHDIEDIGRYGGSDEKRLKKAGFDLRVQRVEAAMKKASTSKEVKELQQIRKQSLDYYNKYNNSKHKS